MAGRRHHTIPQFLSRGFASREGSKGAFVWLYQKGAAGVEANTRNVAVQTDFYGKPTETVDDQITALEGELFAPLVNEIRRTATSKGVAMIDSNIPFLVAHLFTRTAQARKSLIECNQALTTSIRRHFEDREQVTRDIAKGFQNDTAIRVSLRNTLLQQGLSAELADEAIAALEPHWELLAEEIMAEHGAAYLDDISQQLQVAAQENQVTMRTAHNDALAESLATKGHAAVLAAHHWFACRVRLPLILGDCVTVFETTSNRRFKPLATDQSEILNVYLPLSADVVLVGKPSSIPPLVNVNLLNKASAKCSGEFLISSHQLAAQPHLTSSIGQWAGLLSVDERETLANTKLQLFQEQQ